MLDTVGKHKKTIIEHISNLLKENIEVEQMTVFEKIEPLKK